jgi:adenylate cyclase
MALAERAVAADPDDALALALQGWLRIHNRLDFSGLEIVRRAVALNPNNTSVLILAGVAHLRGGDFEEAISISTRALELSPGSPMRCVFMVQIAAARNAVGRYEEAVDVAERALGLNPDHMPCHLALAIGYAQLGRIEEARREVATALRLRPDATIATSMAYRVRYPESVTRWVEGLRKAGMPE